MADEKKSIQMPGLDKTSIEALAELERNTPDSVKKMRSHERLTVRCKVIVQPGNASDRIQMKVQGVTGDMSATGTQVLLPVPIGVGDIFRISFDRTVINVAPTFARCMRCRVVRDDAFETGFSFFSPIDLTLATSTDTQSVDRREIA